MHFARSLANSRGLPVEDMCRPSQTLKGRRLVLSSSNISIHMRVPDYGISRPQRVASWSRLMEVFRSSSAAHKPSLRPNSDAQLGVLSNQLHIADLVSLIDRGACDSGISLTICKPQCRCYHELQENEGKHEVKDSRSSFNEPIKFNLGACLNHNAYHVVFSLRLLDAVAVVEELLHHLRT